MLVILQHGLQQESFATKITHKGPFRVVETFMKIKIIFVVELLSALITGKFGADFMLEFKMISAAAGNTERFLAELTLKPCSLKFINNICQYSYRQWKSSSFL